MVDGTSSYRACLSNMNGSDDNSLMNGVISSGDIMLQPSATVSSMNETQNHGLTTIDNDTRRPNEVRTSKVVNPL